MFFTKFEIHLSLVRNLEFYYLELFYTFLNLLLTFATSISID